MVSMACSMRFALITAILAATALPLFAGRQNRVDLRTLETPTYIVEGDAFVGHNGERYCNRPLYCNHLTAVAFGGDKPYVMVGSNKTILGNLMFALVRNGKGVWLQNASDITSKYRPGRMEWIVKDATWGATTIHLEAVPTAQGAGVVTHLRADDAVPGDTLIWASGSAIEGKQSVLWEYDMTSQKVAYMTRGFSAADCENNIITLKNGVGWSLQASATSPMAAGVCSEISHPIIADAGAWKDPVALLASNGSSQPIACGSIPLTSDHDIYWRLRGPQGADEGADKSPAEEFAAGMERVETIEKQVVVDTPDPWLNAAVGASTSVIDGLYRGNIYTHAGMRWGVPLLGWRTLYGGTVYGWHDNVKADAAYCIAKQITQSDKTTPQADPATELTSQSPDSRMFGRGRVNVDQPHHYDMQSQFFDQVEHAWRWTGDADLEKLLRPSLELHCEYLKDCFDPEGLGIYESYANSWPTDDQWYNGGGTSEETAYAYRAEQTALQLAQRAGDQAAIKLHTAAVARIRQGFFDLLWIPEHGYPGAYRDQIGLKRLHESPWLYGIFCPIDAGLLDTEQAAQALQYTEWGLERMKLPYGGEQCWPSNWVPSIWSVREMWPGDNYQLALAYFQTGLPDDGWKLLRGTFPQQLLFGTVPGDLGHPAGATDFNDCVSPFARSVVEGLFGYVPDYPNGIVKIAPQFPGGWDHASITTPDMSIAYRRAGVETDCKITLAHASPLEVQLPVSTHGVQAVTVDGQPVKWKLTPGFGRSLVDLTLPSTTSAAIEITCRDALKNYPAVVVAGNTGDPVTLQAEDGRIVDFHDPQGVLEKGRVADGALTGVLTANAGDHLVFGLAQVGDAQQWRLYKIHVTDVKTDQAVAAKTGVEVTSNTQWDPINLKSVLNGDIRAIYQQQYLSPRPNTCSLRLATDGYATWQMVLAKNYKAPEIDLANVPSLTDSAGRVVAGKGIPFLWPAEKNNIAFTSRWDNWPRQVSVPVNKTGAAVWFLLCGTTNPMQVLIANAELRMTYADGVIEKLEIVPPFNFWTLCPFGGVDYDYARDGFALPKTPPATVQLGKNCRGIVLGWNLRPGVPLKTVTLETLSQEVVIGLMGLTIMN